MAAKTLTLCALLVLGSVAVAPTASAHHCQAFRDPPDVCYDVEPRIHNAQDLVTCLLYTGPILWYPECTGEPL